MKQLVLLGLFMAGLSLGAHADEAEKNCQQVEKKADQLRLNFISRRPHLNKTHQSDNAQKQAASTDKKRKSNINMISRRPYRSGRY